MEKYLKPWSKMCRFKSYVSKHLRGIVGTTQQNTIYVKINKKYCQHFQLSILQIMRLFMKKWAPTVAKILILISIHHIKGINIGTFLSEN